MSFSFSKAVNTKIIIRQRKIYFPYVSFCNMNPVSFTRISTPYSKDQPYSDYRSHMLSTYTNVLANIDNYFDLLENKSAVSIQIEKKNKKQKTNHICLCGL